MAAASASARGQQVAILASPLAELTGFRLAVDCLTLGCSGERMFAITKLATFYGDKTTVGDVVAPNAMLGRLWAPCRRGVAGDRTSAEHARQTAPGGAAGARGT